MTLESEYINGNRTSKVYSDFMTGYIVEYYINGKILRKTHHTQLNLAEELAEDFVDEAGLNPTLLNE